MLMAIPYHHCPINRLSKRSSRSLKRERIWVSGRSVLLSVISWNLSFLDRDSTKFEKADEQESKHRRSTKESDEAVIIEKNEFKRAKISESRSKSRKPKK